MKKSLFCISTLLVAVTMLAAVVPTKAEEKEEPRQILIENVRIWSAPSKVLSEPSSVLIENNLIKKISSSKIPVREGAGRVDGGGRTLIPGMHDQHVHLAIFNPLSDGERQNMTPFHVGAVAAARGERILMNGFTTVRDLGGPAKFLQRVVDAGVVVGPRIFPSENYLTQTSGHADLRKLNDRHPVLSGQGPDHWFETDVSFIVDGPDAVRMAVRENLRRGATQIKIMGSGGVTSEFDPLHSVQYQPDEIQMAVKTAAQWETYVAAHVFTEKAITNCIENGVKVLEHIPFLTEKAAKLMVEKQIMFATAVAPVFSVSVEQAEAFYTPNSFKKWKSVRDAGENMVNLIKTVPGMIDLFTFGTDLVNNWELTLEQDKKMNDEFLWLDKAGFSAFDILRVATANGARMNELSGPNHPYQEGPLGVIEEGAYADLLLVDGNPLEDITLLAEPDKNLKLIMKDGVIYKNTLLREMISPELHRKIKEIAPYMRRFGDYN